MERVWYGMVTEFLLEYVEVMLQSGLGLQLYE